MSFLDTLINAESGGKNISGLGGAQGYFQITPDTWRDFAPHVNIDLSQYPNPLSAPLLVQKQVASVIPEGRWGPRTQRILQQNYGTLDPTLPMGHYLGLFGDSSGGPPAPEPPTGFGLPSPNAVSMPLSPALPQVPGDVTTPPAAPQQRLPFGMPPASFGDAVTQAAQQMQQQLDPRTRSRA
jgi:hypothetical protein